MTGYQAVIGPNTAFTPDFKPLQFKDFTDGVNATILVGESRSLVPWTKPEDLPLDMNLPLSGLGSHHGYHNNGFNALFADGSVRFLKSLHRSQRVSRCSPGTGMTRYPRRIIRKSRWPSLLVALNHRLTG